MKEAHSYNSIIPYPEDAIQSQDWDEIASVVINAKFDTDLYNYIFNDADTKENGKELELKELAKEYGN